MVTVSWTGVRCFVQNYVYNVESKANSVPLENH